MGLTRPSRAGGGQDSASMDWPWAARPPPRSGVGATPAGGASQGLLPGLQGRRGRGGGQGAGRVPPLLPARWPGSPGKDSSLVEESCTSPCVPHMVLWRPRAHPRAGWSPRSFSSPVVPSPPFPFVPLSRPSAPTSLFPRKLDYKTTNNTGLLI